MPTMTTAEAIIASLIAHGLDTIAVPYLRSARHGYRRWGAEGKVQQLDRLFPYARTDEGSAVGSGTVGFPIEQLDLMSGALRRSGSDPASAR